LLYCKSSIAINCCAVFYVYELLCCLLWQWVIVLSSMAMNRCTVSCGNGLLYCQLRQWIAVLSIFNVYGFLYCLLCLWIVLLSIFNGSPDGLYYRASTIVIYDRRSISKSPFFYTQHNARVIYYDRRRFLMLTIDGAGRVG